MKQKYYLSGAVCATLLSVLGSCINDTGNYDYIPESELLPVTIDTLAESYGAYQGDSLIITPTLLGVKDESRYAYRWYATNANREVFDLADTKDFRDIVRLPQAEYTLYYEVKDPATDVYRRATTKLSVTALIQNGWYVLKELDGTTDFDYQGLDSTRVDNVLQNIVGEEQLEGAPLKLIYQPNYYYTEVENEDGSVTLLRNQKAIHILSEREFTTLNATSLQPFKHYRDVFYDFPANAMPGQLGFDNDATLFYIDNGLLYSCSIGGAGKFGTPKYIGNFNYDYDLFPGQLLLKNYVLVYDRLSHTFYKGEHNNTYLSVFEDNSDGLSSTSIQGELLALVQSTTPYGATNGYALFKNEDPEIAGEHFIFSLSLGSWSASAAKGIFSIPAECALPHSTVFGANINVDNTIYFSRDNGPGSELMMHTIADVPERETSITTFPNEQVTSIQNINGKLPGNSAKTNYLVVTTRTAIGWKAYFFTFVGGKGPEVNPTPVYTLTGEGTAKQIMYYSSN